MLQRLPADYVSYRETNGHLTKGFMDGVPKYFELFPLDSIAEQNVILETHKYALELTAFGSNGSNELLVFDEAGAVLCISAFDHDSQNAVKVADSWSEFQKRIYPNGKIPGPRSRFGMLDSLPPRLAHLKDRAIEINAVPDSDEEGQLQFLEKLHEHLKDHITGLSKEDGLRKLVDEGQLLEHWLSENTGYDELLGLHFIAGCLTSDLDFLFEEQRRIKFRYPPKLR